MPIESKHEFDASVMELNEINRTRERKRLFFDMDGTMAVFKPVDTLETLYEKGYFLNLEPIPAVLKAVKEIVISEPDVEVYVLSAVLSDSPFALNEKNEWLDTHLPEIPANRRIFPPCGTDKKEYIPGGVRPSDVLCDDYTHNLCLWEPPAKGVKLLNGINHSKGTWRRDCIRFDKSPSEIAKDIVDIVKGIRMVRDDKPIIQEAEALTSRNTLGGWKAEIEERKSANRQTSDNLVKDAKNKQNERE